MRHTLLIFLIAIIGAGGICAEIKIGDSFESIQKRYGKNGDIDKEGFGGFTYHLSHLNLRINFDENNNVVSYEGIPIDGVLLDAIGINPFRFRLGKMFPDPASQIGKDIEGFKLIAYKEKYEEREVKGKMMKVNVSEYTLERKGKKIILIYGQDRQHDEYLVRFSHIPTDTKFVRSIGKTFEIEGIQYRLSNVDITNQTCTIVNQKTGGSVVLTKKPKPSIAHLKTKDKLITITGAGGVANCLIKGAILPTSKGHWVPQTLDGNDEDGVWNPTEATIEVAQPIILKYIESSNKIIFGNLGQYRCQYFGIIVKGKKRIYCNFFRMTKSEKDWQTNPVVVDGGGDAYFQLEYDIETRKCLNFSANQAF